MRKFNFTTILILILWFAVFTFLYASDWPMWRYDEGRSANSPEQLPGELHHQWTWQFSQREPVWDDPLNQDLMNFDEIFEPVVMGNTLFVGFNDKDKVIAIDTDTGKIKWTFYADGPIRLPIACANDKIYFTSDDGYIYCLLAKRGDLVWKFRGGPFERKILGNKRLISTWPARGGVVIKNDIVYFAASIWPFMGTFIYALDAETGNIIWRNEETSFQYRLQPHNAPAFAGVAPQGALTISNDLLLVSGGRSVPACFNRSSGKMIYYRFAKHNKTGGSFVCANDDYFFNHYRDRDTDLYDVKTGMVVEKRLGKYPVLTENVFFMSGDSILVKSAQDPSTTLSIIPVDASGDLIKAGSCLYAAGRNQITAIRLDPFTLKPSVEWTKPIDGRVKRLVAANGRLFAVTLDGRLLAFGQSEQWPVVHLPKEDPFTPSVKATQIAATICEQTNAKSGYALFYGIGNGELLAALAMNSDLHVTAIEPNRSTVQKFRKRFDEAGLLGKKISILPGSLDSFLPPAYMASLIVIHECERISFTEDASHYQSIFKALLPFGGKLWLQKENADRINLPELVAKHDESELQIQHFNKSVLVAKNGPLKGAANWTHQYGDLSNTVKSDDQRVKLPLGLLWFGGSSNLDVLPRHGFGPPEQIVDGRLIIEGMDCISARDVYTGRVLWKTMLDSLDTFGSYYNSTYENSPLKVSYNQEKLPGAKSRGTNFVATADYVYVIEKSCCRVLDITNGSTVDRFTLPAETGGQIPQWGYIGVLDNLLVGGAGFVPFSQLTPRNEEEKNMIASLPRPKDQRTYITHTNYDNIATQKIIVMDRYSGNVKWQSKARYAYIHNTIIASKNCLFFLDKLHPGTEQRMKRRGLKIPSDYRLFSVDANFGKVIWCDSTNVFGSWLGYSKEYDLLVQSTRPSRDMIRGERGERMSVFHALTGELIWDRAIRYNNPPILHGDKIITDNAAYDIHTGDIIYRTDPLTGEEIKWTYSRTYGCNYNIASEHLLSFRSGAAGFYDFERKGGTGNLGGFKSGCTSNLIAAGGLLNAPDYTRTCQCSYQNQTSLAFIHMPELEYWTTNDWQWNGKPIRQVGINLNAPGDRLSDEGTLWMDYPSVGGPSPDIPIDCDSVQISGTKRHSLFLKSNGLEWIGASSLNGIIDLSLTLQKEPGQSLPYTVKLYFAELEKKRPGERVFDVYLQDRKVLERMDIVKEAKQPNLTIVKTFGNINVSDKLNVRCLPSDKNDDHQASLSGIELILEEPGD